MRLSTSRHTLSTWYGCIQTAVLNGTSPGLSSVELFDGQLEPPCWFETSFEQRHLCARNHVRRLLRGKLWYEAQASHLPPISPELGRDAPARHPPLTATPVLGLR